MLSDEWLLRYRLLENFLFVPYLHNARYHKVSQGRQNVPQGRHNVPQVRHKVPQGGTGYRKVALGTAR